MVATVEKYKSMYIYVFFGVLTTAVNIITYLFLTNILNTNYIIANSIAWITSVMFAFFTNKFYVFKSKTNTLGLIIKEASLFTFLRLLSYFLDISLMIFLVDKLDMNDFLSKIIVNVIIIIFNYSFSKRIIFKITKKEVNGK